MNEIHPTAIIGPGVVIGKGNKILPYTIITGPIEIGDDNVIGPHVVIGSPGGDTKIPRYDSSNCSIKIGDRNIIREFCAVQKPRYEEITLIGNDVHIMQGSSISHDVKLSDKVVIGPNCNIAGLVRVLEGANISMGVSIHQYCVIGQYSISGMGSAVVKNVKPFSRYIPNKPISVNNYLVKKFGFEEFFEEINKYVLDDIKPQSSIIGLITEGFNTHHMWSKRDMY